jgi:outer membrane receptor protein involved in Fe transport
MLYAGLDNVTLRSGMNVLKGNPDLEPETNLTYEIGVKVAVPWGGVASATLFSKQTENQVDTKTFIPSNSRFAGDYGFAEYVNQDRAEAKGVEFRLEKDRGRVTGGLSYVFMHARGISGSAEQGLRYYQWGFPLTSRLAYLSWDQRHTLKADAVLRPGRGWEAGVIAEFHSPRPYTYFPSRDGRVPDDPLAPFVPNNRRMEAYRMLSLKVSKGVRVGAWGVDRIVLYADSRNLMNWRNVAWMDASGRIGGELGDPGGYGTGRRTRAGLEVRFR